MVIFTPGMQPIVLLSSLPLLQKVGEGGEGRVRELEGQLEEASHDREELRQEVDRLTASLDQADQLKTQAEDSAQQVVGL